MNSSEKSNTASSINVKKVTNLSQKSNYSKSDKNEKIKLKPDFQSINLNILPSNNHWKVFESNNHLKVSPHILHNVSKDSHISINLDKYCKYLNLVPKWVLKKKSKEVLYRDWPLRLISKRNSNLSSASIFNNLHLDINHYQKFLQINPELHRLSKNKRILNEFNSNLSRQLKCKIYFKNIANRPSSNHLVHCLADLKVMSNNFHHRVSGYSPHWTLYSKHNLLHAMCSNPFNESQLRSLREARKILSVRLSELEFSSPLGKHLLKSFFTAIRFGSKKNTFDYEKFCSTDPRLYSYFYKIPNYSHSHLHSQFKPLRTLRSNTIIEEKYSPNTNSRAYTHTYCFNRKQRYLKWNRIDSSLNLKSYSYPLEFTSNFFTYNFLNKSNSNTNSTKSNLLSCKFRNKSQLMDPLISLTNFDSTNQKVTDFEKNVQLLSEKKSKSLTTKPFNNCGYDIVFTPIEDAKSEIYFPHEPKFSNTFKLNCNGIPKNDLNTHLAQNDLKNSASKVIKSHSLPSKVDLKMNSQLSSQSKVKKSPDVSSLVNFSEECKLIEVKAPQEVNCSIANIPTCDVKIESASKPNERLFVIRTHAMESEESRNRVKKMEIFDDVVRIVKVNPKIPRKRQFSFDQEEVAWVYVDKVEKSKKRKV